MKEKPCKQNTKSLHTTASNLYTSISQLYNTLHNYTKLYNILQNKKLLQTNTNIVNKNINSTHVFNFAMIYHTFVYNTFAKLHKTLQHFTKQKLYNTFVYKAFWDVYNFWQNSTNLWKTTNFNKA